jgi:hypothetical protein
MCGALVDPQGSIYNERTAVIIPTQQTALEPNEVIKVHIPLESVKPEVERSNIQVEVVGGAF